MNKTTIRVIISILVLSIFILFILVSCESLVKSKDDQESPNGDDNNDGQIVHIGEFLTCFTTKDSYYNDLNVIYAITRGNESNRLVEIPLNPGNFTYLTGETGLQWVGHIVVQNSNIYWHDNGTFYWVPVSGGNVKSVSTGGYVIDSDPIVALPYIYYIEFITDTFQRINISGGTPEDIDNLPLGGGRDVARDKTTLYWIGAEDGSYLRSMPSAGGTKATLLSGSNNIYFPSNLRAVPNSQGKTVLYWQDILSNGNDVIRKFPLPNGPVVSIMNAEFILDFAITEDAIYWHSPGYIGKYDLSTLEFTYPVNTGTITIHGFGINGNSIYYTEQDGLVYQVPR